MLKFMNWEEQFSYSFQSAVLILEIHIFEFHHIILLYIYLYPASMGLSSTHKQPATSWPGSSPCRALHQYCKGQGSGIPIQAYSLAIICLLST